MMRRMVFVAHTPCDFDIEKELIHFCIHREETHLQILQAFVDLHEFSNLNLVQALRWVEIFISSVSYVILTYSDFFCWNFVWICDCLIVDIGSSCGVSVYLVRLRRSTAWWRPLLCGTAPVTLGFFSPQVDHLCIWRIGFVFDSQKKENILIQQTIRKQNDCFSLSSMC